jgi:hypothetical protein
VKVKLADSHLLIHQFTNCSFKIRTQKHLPQNFMFSKRLSPLCFFFIWNTKCTLSFSHSWNFLLCFKNHFPSERKWRWLAHYYLSTIQVRDTKNSICLKQQNTTIYAAPFLLICTASPIINLFSTILQPTSKNVSRKRPLNHCSMLIPGAYVVLFYSTGYHYYKSF